MKVTESGYECACPWPEDCSVQSGDSGVVFRRESKGGSYSTAFFEAFPMSPGCFIRGEGDTVRDAEAHAYDTFLRYQACDHDFERLNQEGRGQCRKCRLKTDDALPSEHQCVECQAPDARFLSPFGSYLNEGKASEYSCFNCLVQVVGPRYQDTPLADLMPAGLDEDRDEAQSWFGETLEDHLTVHLAITLADVPGFTAMDAKSQSDTLQHLVRMVFRNLLRLEASLVEQMLELDMPGLRYLDEAAFMQACIHPVVIAEGTELARLAWLRKQGQLEGDGESQVQAAYKELQASVATYVCFYVQHCAEKPPAHGEQRKRISTRSEFRSALTQVVEALASAVPDDDAESSE